MNPIYRQIANNKINNLTTDDLIRYASMYQIRLTRVQAEKVLKIFRRESIDIGNKKQRNYILNQIGKEVDVEIQKKVNYLLSQFLN